MVPASERQCPDAHTATTYVDWHVLREVFELLPASHPHIAWLLNEVPVLQTKSSPSSSATTTTISAPSSSSSSSFHNEDCVADGVDVDDFNAISFLAEAEVIWEEAAPLQASQPQWSRRPIGLMQGGFVPYIHSLHPMDNDPRCLGGCRGSDGSASRTGTGSGASVESGEATSTASVAGDGESAAGNNRLNEGELSTLFFAQDMVILYEYEQREQAEGEEEMGEESGEEVMGEMKRTMTAALEENVSDGMTASFLMDTTITTTTTPARATAAATATATATATAATASIGEVEMRMGDNDHTAIANQAQPTTSITTSTTPTASVITSSSVGNNGGSTGDDNTSYDAEGFEIEMF